MQEEFFVSGTASCYETPRLVTVRVIESGNPYQTRMMVRRPLDPARSNGVVVVEWLNASSGYEIDSTWAAASYEAYIRAGTTWVGLSLQNNVVQHLRTWSPQRYGSLNVEPRAGSSCPASADTPLTPENVRINNLAFDILSQAGQAIRRPVGVDPLHGLRRNVLISAGASQSAARLVPYVNSVHPLAWVYDGFFLAIPVFDNVIRQDRGVHPAGHEGLQGDVRVRRDGQHRGEPPTGQRDAPELGGGGSAAHHLPQRAVRIPNNARDDLPPITFCTGLPPGTEPISRIPSRYVMAAAAHHLVRWIRNGTAPPPSLRIETVPGTNEIIRDQYGNALGGIRLSQHEVATATNNGGTDCSTYGWHRPFDQATLNALYPSHRAYVQQVVHVTQRNLRAGYILQPDARTTILEAEQSNIGQSRGGARPT